MATPKTPVFKFCPKLIKETFMMAFTLMKIRVRPSAQLCRAGLVIIEHGIYGLVARLGFKTNRRMRICWGIAPAFN